MDVLGGASSPWVTRESTYGHVLRIAHPCHVPEETEQSCLDERQQPFCLVCKISKKVQPL